MGLAAAGLIMLAVILYYACRPRVEEEYRRPGPLPLERESFREPFDWERHAAGQRDRARRGLQ